MQPKYIHISEAVKQYDKTRQTFYNYIHKSLVRTKKINNRTYLNVDDIEELLSDYINTWTSQKNNEELVEEIYDDLSTQKQILQNTIEEHTLALKSEINTHRQVINQEIQSTQFLTQTLQWSVESLLTRFHHQSQKQVFLITMLALLVVHGVILSVL